MEDAPKKIGDKEGFIHTADEVKWVAANVQGKWWAFNSLRRNGWSEEKLHALLTMPAVYKYRDNANRGAFSVDGLYAYLPAMDEEFEETMKVLEFIGRHRNPDDTPYVDRE